MSGDGSVRPATHQRKSTEFGSRKFIDAKELNGMNTAIQRLQSLRVSHVMHREVVLLRADQTLTEAAALLAQHEISGAPVVDAEGRCVGVLTSTDFVRRHGECRAGGSTTNGGLPKTGWYGEERVGERMWPSVLTVNAHTALLEAARRMCDMHVHRLFIVDEHAHPVGVLSTLDVVAALTQAIDEGESQRR
jgi:CBS-domain-containing membrane protein